MQRSTRPPCATQATLRTMAGAASLSTSTSSSAALRAGADRWASAGALASQQAIIAPQSASAMGR